MPYLRPSGRFATVPRGGRRFVVRPPTVSTIYSALTNLPEEIAALVKAYKAEPAVGTEAALGSMVQTIVKVAGQRLVPVLETCATLYDAPPWALREELALDPQLAVPLVLAAIDMVDMAALYADSGLVKLDPDNMNAGPTEDELAVLNGTALNSLDRVIVRVAWKFAQPPQTVMDWPWEAFIAATKSLPTLRDDVQIDPQAVGPETPYYEGSPIDAALGISYTRAAPDNA